MRPRWRVVACPFVGRRAVGMCGGGANGGLPRRAAMAPYAFFFDQLTVWAVCRCGLGPLLKLRLLAHRGAPPPPRLFDVRRQLCCSLPPPQLLDRNSDHQHQPPDSNSNVCARRPQAAHTARQPFSSWSACTPGGSFVCVHDRRTQNCLCSLSVLSSSIVLCWPACLFSNLNQAVVSYEFEFFAAPPPTVLLVNQPGAPDCTSAARQPHLCLAAATTRGPVPALHVPLLIASSFFFLLSSLSLFLSPSPALPRRLFQSKWHGARGVAGEQ